jgi:hypothetical protein
MQVYGRAQRAIVELEDDDEASCAHCIFVRDNAGTNEPGSVFFVHEVAAPLDTIRRVEIVMMLGDTVALKCERVTAERAANEAPS